jgi:hypothetical protein
VTYDEARFYRSANTAVAVGTGVITGLALGWAIRRFSALTWLYFVASQGCMWWGILITPDWVDHPEQEGFTGFQWCLFIAAAVLFILAIREGGRSLRRFAQAQLAAQQEWAAQQVPAPVPAPTTQRVTRTVTVTRAPVRNEDAQQRSQGTTGTSPRRPEPRPVRSIEQHGNLRITDRRPFDPELGE